MSWELIGGVAAGLAEAKRKADQDRDIKEYRDAAKELYKAQAESFRRRRETPAIPGASAPAMPGDPVMDPDRDGPTRKRMRLTGTPEADNDGLEYARGGMVGAADSEITEWNCRGGESHSGWQKQSFKK